MQPGARDGLSAAPKRRFFASYPDTATGHAIESAMYAAHGVGPKAAENYQTALTELRKHATEAAPMLDQAFDLVPDEVAIERHQITHTLAALKSHAAESALERIAALPLPEPAADAASKHREPDFENEVMIRYAAIDGLRDLALRGNARALKSLEDLVNQSAPGIRGYALQAHTESLSASNAIDDALLARYWNLPQAQRVGIGVVRISAYDMPVQTPAPIQEEP